MEKLSRVAEKRKFLQVCATSNASRNGEDDAPLSVVGSVVHDSKGHLLNAEEDGGPTRCTALCRDFGSDGVAASVVRDGDRLDGRGSGGDAPAVAGARGRLVA